MFRRLILAWKIARGFPHDNKWELDWQLSDRDWLRSALSTYSGNKLWNMLRQEVGSTAIWAVNRTDSVRSCGYAAGVAYIVGMIEACLPEKQKAEPRDEFDIETSMLDQ